MPHQPTRELEKFRTQRKSTDAVVTEIGRIMKEMGVDKAEFKPLSDWSENWFGLEFRLYYPDGNHFMTVRRISKAQDRQVDNAAVILEWLHRRWMGVVKGLETLEEAFIGLHLSYDESHLPEPTVRRLTEGPNRIFQANRTLTDGKAVLQLPGQV